MGNTLKKAGLLAGSLLLLIPAVLGAAPAPPPPHFAGSWDMNPTKSQVSDGRVMTLKIEELAGDKLKFSFAIRKAGSETTSSFECAASGAECDFNQNGHKAKVSMWYAGPTLNLCKTNGPDDDAVSEWKLEMSPDSKALTFTITHITPEAKDEILVFDRKSAD